jgi:CBS domain-containing protein
MKVRELLERKGGAVISVGRRDPVNEAARLLLKYGIGGLPVLDADGSVCGFLAERDIVRAAHEGSDAFRREPVERIMRPPPVCPSGDTLQNVMTRMTRERLRHLIVMDGNRITGVISVGDLVKHRLQQLETETGVLRDYVFAQRARQ